MSKPYKIIDLFAGAGGMSLGFHRAGFKSVLAVEKEPDFAATYRENFATPVIVDDISEVVDAGGIQMKADVVVGGPPCQGFSNLTGNKATDPRRAMWKFFMDVVEASECKVFVVENVQNLLSSPEGHAIINRGRQLGFTITDDSTGLLLASDYSVPQNRKRAFIVGSKLGPLALPKPYGQRVSVREAFAGQGSNGDVAIPLAPLHSDLPSSPAQGPDLHISRNPTRKSLDRYAVIPPGGNRFDLQKARPDLTPDCWKRKTKGGTDLFGRLHWDEPARCTIRTEFYKPEKGRYLHPSENRPITHWEAARLQTFPDSFKWHGTRIRVAIQIGNAVPPLLGEAVAKTVMHHLMKHKCPVTRATRIPHSEHVTGLWS